MTLKLASSSGGKDKQMVYAEVYAPLKPDTDGDYMTAEDIEIMAYKFMRELKQKKVDTNHDNKIVDACVVESFIARKGDPDFIEGAWVVGIHIEDASTWDAVKKGEINGFSMEALVHRVPDTLSVEVPPVVKGKTTKAEDDHEHEFFVSFSATGEFQGGYTSVTKEHSHKISSGTITDVAQGHTHRFSFVESAYV